jgi:hypothetical protein
MKRATTTLRPGPGTGCARDTNAWLVFGITIKTKLILFVSTRIRTWVYRGKSPKACSIDRAEIVFGKRLRNEQQYLLILLRRRYAPAIRVTRYARFMIYRPIDRARYCFAIVVRAYIDANRYR